MLAGPNPKKRKLNQMSNDFQGVDPNAVNAKLNDRLRELEAQHS
jgi:hypothetical protein